MIVVVYDTEKIKDTGVNVEGLPRNKNYIILPFQHTVKKIKVLNNIHVEVEHTGTPFDFMDKSNVHYHNLIKLLDNKPEFVLLNSKLDYYILVNMMHIHNWKSVTAKNIVENEVTKLRVSPDEKYIEYFNNMVWSTGGVPYYDFTPLKIGQESILIPKLQEMLLYWENEPHTLTPTFEDYVKKYMNIMRTDSTREIILFEPNNKTFKSYTGMVSGGKTNGLITIHTVYHKSSQLYTMFNYTVYGKNINTVKTVSIINIHMPDGEVESLGVIVSFEDMDYRIIKNKFQILSESEFKHILDSMHVPVELLRKKYEEVVNQVLSST